MRERILKFIEKEGLTAGEFADKIGVQRSSVSHVLNGRNNPGFSFIQKILDTYPEINSRWLLTGAGDIYDPAVVKKEENRKQQVEQHDLFSTANSQKGATTTNFTKPPENAPSKADSEHEISSEPPVSTQKHIKKVVKVLIFYDDHTFEDFRPAE
ncbi:MAG: helix-turn-helix domain-containing protein [Prolixibacteraceae bacterium]|nr:helix-turn-helix domain-containing protein [Prolixibacteraceae bacterium]